MVYIRFTACANVHQTALGLTAKQIGCCALHLNSLVLQSTAVARESLLCSAADFCIVIYKVLQLLSATVPQQQQQQQKQRKQMTAARSELADTWLS